MIVSDGRGSEEDKVDCQDVDVTLAYDDDYQIKAHNSTISFNWPEHGP